MSPNTPASIGSLFVANKSKVVYEILVTFQYLRFANFGINAIWAYKVHEDIQIFFFKAEPNTTEQGGSSLDAD
jgi:hypothetical protein